LLYLVEENLSSEEIPNKEEDKLWYSWMQHSSCGR
jgi:hypothetical protein